MLNCAVFDMPLLILFACVTQYNLYYKRDYKIYLILMIVPKQWLIKYQGIIICVLDGQCSSKGTLFLNFIS